MTSNNKFQDLRSGRVKPHPIVKNVKEISPTSKSKKSKPVHVGGGSGEPRDWSGGTDDEVSGLPNWTQRDNDDPWHTWDGCVPIAASMIIGYHEGIERGAQDPIIDDLHRCFKTKANGDTDFWQIDNGFERYDNGLCTYTATTRRTDIKHLIKTAVGNNNPPCLATSGTYFDAPKGHATAVAGYREHDCGGWWGLGGCALDIKVHTGWKDNAGQVYDPDCIAAGNWTSVQVTTVKVKSGFIATV